MPRFTDNQDGTITDTETDLTWFKKDSRQLTGRWMHLEKSQKLAKEQNEAKTGSFSDWRVPKMEDIKTIFDKSFSNRDFGNNEIHISDQFDQSLLLSSGCKAGEYRMPPLIN